MSEKDLEAARLATLNLLDRRASDATVCPSEVARALAAAEHLSDWRDRMPIVHAAINRMAHDGAIRLSWKGAVLPSRTGPYRIARAERDS